jgi:hypothetical protein
MSPSAQNIKSDAELLINDENLVKRMDTAEKDQKINQEEAIRNYQLLAELKKPNYKYEGSIVTEEISARTKDITELRQMSNFDSKQNIQLTSSKKSHVIPSIHDSHLPVTAIMRASPFRRDPNYSIRYTASNEDLELTKMYMKLDKAHQAKQFKGSVIKSRRYTHEVNLMNVTSSSKTNSFQPNASGIRFNPFQ